MSPGGSLLWQVLFCGCGGGGCSESSWRLACVFSLLISTIIIANNYYYNNCIIGFSSHLLLVRRVRAICEHCK